MLAAYLETMPEWATSGDRRYLEAMSDDRRRVLDEYVRWVPTLGSFTTFFTATWSDAYAKDHRGLYGPRGAARWTERFLDRLGYNGALVVSPEGHKWRDVYHVHGLTERVDWRRLHAAMREECGPGSLNIGRATAGAMAYALKYTLKDDSEHIIIRRSERGGLVP